MELTRVDSVDSADAERHLLYSHVGIYPDCPSLDGIRGSLRVAPGLTYPTMGRTWKDRMADWLIGAVILMIILLSAMLAVLQFPIPLRQTPIVYHGINLPEYKVYCRGDLFIYSTDIEITEPAVFSLHVGIMDADTKTYILSTIETMPSIPRARPARVTQEIKFPIPDLPSGDYIRVAAIDTYHVDSIPIFVEVPFTVGSCN